MISNRPQHIEPSSTDSTSSDTIKARALRNPREEILADQSASAVMKKPALSDLSENLMEQIADEQNVEKAWRKVKANKGAPAPMESHSRNSHKAFARSGQRSVNNYSMEPTHRNQRGVSPSRKAMAANVTLAFPMSWTDSFNKPSSRS